MGIRETEGTGGSDKLTELLTEAEAVEDAETAEETPAEDPAAPGRKRRGRRSGDPKPWQGKRLVALIAAVAVASLLAGIGIMQFIVSPAELAARTAPPKAGLITVPIEKRKIENAIVTRADIGYAGSVEATIEGGGDRAIVTGRVPKVGSVLKTKSIALEVAGRPVIVLPGDLPAYRDLSVGLAGPDVVQLKAALSGLGYSVDGGNAYTAATAQAVQALYSDIGYPAPTAASGGDEGGGDDGARDVEAAQEAVADAQDALDQARASLAAAGQPRTGSEVVEAQNAVRSAKRDLKAAQRKGASQREIKNLEDEVRLAEVRLAEARAPESTADLSSEVRAAERTLRDAQRTLADLQEAALPGFPSSEVLYLAGLPRRVDEVNVKRGDQLSGSALVVSGNTLTLTATVSKQDAALLEEGVQATFTPPGGEDFKATVKKISREKAKTQDDGEGEEGDGSEEGAGSSDPSKLTVTLEPQKLTSEQVEELRGTNVRLRIGISATKGEVLAVPLAAITAGSGGESRVEVVEGRDAKPDDAEVVEVETGLAAEGYVEIKSDDPRIQEGAYVVVGR